MCSFGRSIAVIFLSNISLQSGQLCIETGQVYDLDTWVHPASTTWSRHWVICLHTSPYDLLVPERLHCCTWQWLGMVTSICKISIDLPGWHIWWQEMALNAHAVLQNLRTAWACSPWVWHTSAVAWHALHSLRAWSPMWHCFHIVEALQRPAWKLGAGRGRPPCVQQQGGCCRGGEPGSTVAPGELLGHHFRTTQPSWIQSNLQAFPGQARRLGPAGGQDEQSGHVQGRQKCGPQWSIRWSRECLSWELVGSSRIVHARRSGLLTF